MHRFHRKAIAHILATLTAFLLLACDKEDPRPVNEEEVITTVVVTLAPETAGDPVILRFYDEDGEHGSIEPVVTVSGELIAHATYTAVIEVLNETEEPAEDVTEEIIGEAEDHLFCFTTSGNLAVAYNDDDRDANGLPLGLATTWTTTDAGEASVTVSLRHQHDTKTGACPGGGDTDIEVTFPLVIGS